MIPLLRWGNKTKVEKVKGRAKKSKAKKKEEKRKKGIVYFIGYMMLKLV